MNRMRGFTLLEILVALMLFATVGGALLQLYHQGLRQTAQSNAYLHAAVLARSKLNELQAFETLTPGTSDGDFGNGFAWRLVASEASEWDEPGPSPWQPIKLALSVSWGADRNARAIEVETVLLSRSAQ